MGKKAKPAKATRNTRTEVSPGVSLEKAVARVQQIQQIMDPDSAVTHNEVLTDRVGYAAFACDRHGDGKSTEHPAEAGKMAGEVRRNI